MNKFVDGIVFITKSIISISVNIGANLLVSTCLGSQVHFGRAHFTLQHCFKYELSWASTLVP